MAIALARGKIFVQARDAQLRDASIHGIPIQSISGTMVYGDGVLRVYSAQARAAGGRVVAAGSFATARNASGGTLSLATTQLDAGALHAFGVPLQRGGLRAVGSIAPGGALPKLDAGIVLDRASASGYGPFTATADVAIASDRVRIGRATAGFGTTFARVSGTIGNLAARVPRYDIVADVPSGDIASAAGIAAAARIAALRKYAPQGSFEGAVTIGGSGRAPTVNGDVIVPVGSINGLGFSDARARIAIASGGVAVQNGTVVVGGTRAGFSADTSKTRMAFSLSSAHADLSDFNDFFDTGDTLSGTGYVFAQFARSGDSITTTANVGVKGLRYRRLPIGDTFARWSSTRNVVNAVVDVGGAQGRLHAQGSVALARSAQLAQIVRGSRYNLHADVQNLDAGTWVAALGFPQVPITGRFDAAGALLGSFPHLAIAGNAALRDGTLGPMPIEHAEASVRTRGGRIEVTQAAVSLPALDATGSGTFGFARTSPIAFTAHVVTSDLPRLVARMSKKRLDLSGRFDSTLSVRGTIAKPALSGDVAMTDAQVYGVRIPSFTGQVALSGRNLIVRNAQVRMERGSASLAGSIPLQLRPFGIGPASAPLSAQLVADNLDLAPLGVFLKNDTVLGGVLSGNIALSGSVASPRLFGTLGVTGGSYVSSLETAPVTGTVAQMTFGGTDASLNTLRARMGNGTINGSGSLRFGGHGWHGGPLDYAIGLVARGARIAMPQYGSGTFDADLRLSRSGGALGALSGAATISDAVIPFGAFMKFGGGSATGNASAPALPFNLRFNLAIAAAKNVVVRGGGAGVFGLDIAARGRATLAGTLAQPTLAGQFNSSGGTLTYIDHAFRVETGSVTFSPRNGVIPEVYAVGTTHVTNPDPNTQRNPTGAADITVTVTGLVTSPKIAFASDPPGYTDRQIIALLLPLGGLVGPIQFTDTTVVLPEGQLSGAPEAGTGALLPSVLVRRENGTLTVGQEAFNILNAQFASGLLAPIENALGTSLGFSDVNLTLDYTGNVGINVRRSLLRDLYAVYGTTFGVPVRQTFGLSYQPNAFTSAQATFFVQNGTVPLFLAPNQAISTNPRATTGQAIQGNSGFTFLYQRLF